MGIATDLIKVDSHTTLPVLVEVWSKLLAWRGLKPNVVFLTVLYDHLVMFDRHFEGIGDPKVDFSLVMGLWEELIAESLNRWWIFASVFARRQKRLFRTRQAAPRKSGPNLIPP